jgi:heterodisulfide reductase subunit A-like polyferredoxin
MNDAGVFFCRCSAGIIAPEKLDSIAGVVAQSGAHVVELNDLCALSMDKTAELRELNDRFRHKVVIACYPRAVENILAQAGVPVQDMKVLNFRKMSAVEIASAISGQAGNGSPVREVLSSDLKVPAWFPVIERARCNSCGQCARFCLFGVYRYADKKLMVENPLNCKNNCPACARACPVSAIIFPRIKEEGTIAGAEPGEVTIDRSAAQSGSLLGKLQQRGDVRRNIFRSNLLQQAEEERRKAIEAFKKQNS